MRTLRIFILFIATGLFFTGCVKDVITVEEIPFEFYTQDELNTLQTKLSLGERPDVYNSPTGVTNSVTSAQSRKGVMGRVLFYDKELSSDKSVSCSSCHDNTKGFADDKAFSDGPENRKTARNTLGLGVVRSFQHYYGSSFSATAKFFWDERSPTLSNQTEETIQNPDEMGLDMDVVLDYVKNQEEYQILHKYSFPNQEMTKDHILDALGVFVNSITSTDSKFDAALINSGSIENEFQHFTDEENVGRAIFVQNCNSCHGFSVAAPSFFGSGSFTTVANNGLDLNYEDKGVGSHTNKTSDNGVFKVPGLRNVELTAPYMHDGRFATLADVVDFYNDGIQDHANLHPDLKSIGGGAKKLDLSSSEKDALVAFLETLTDKAQAEEVKWADPFLN